MKAFVIISFLMIFSGSAIAQTSAVGLPKITEEKAKQIQCAIENVSKLMAIPATTVGLGKCSQFESLAKLVVANDGPLSKFSCGLTQAEATQVVNGLYLTFFGDRALAQCLR